MPIQRVTGLLGDAARGAGNLVFGPGAFGDPQEAFRRNVPPGLLAQFDEERQRELGERLQGQLRGAGSRSLIVDGFQEGLRDDVENRQAAAVAERQGASDAKLRQQLLDSNVSPEMVRILLDAPPEERGKLFFNNQANVSAGSTRVDAFGNELATNPTTDVQEALFRQSNPQAQEEFEAQRAAEGQFTLAPGQGRFDALGNPIVSQDTTRAQDAAAGVREEDPSTTALKTRRGIIADLQKTFPGMTEQQATDLHDNNVRFFQNPITGRTAQGNARTNTQSPTLDPNAPDLTSIGSQTGGVPEGADVSQTTGIAGAAKRAVNTLFDIAGGGTPFSDTDEASVALNNFNQRFKLTLADVMSEGRRSNLLLEMLDSLVANPANIAQGSENARRQIEQGKALLEEELLEPLFIIQNEQGNTDSRVQQARLRERKLRNLIQGLDTFLGAFGQSGGAGQGDLSQLSDEELEAIASGQDGGLQ